MASTMRPARADPSSLRVLARSARARLRTHADRTRLRLREQLLPLRIRHVGGARRVAATRGELIVVCLVRDGAVYLDRFLRHYRALGAKHIVFLDNGSGDGTPGRAAREAGVTVLRTAAPYRDYKTMMKRYLINRFGRDNWVLCVDIDELFDYPFRERLPLAGLLAYLNGRNYTAVVAHLLDLFPRGALQAESGQAWWTDHRFYDNDGLTKYDYREAYEGRVVPSNDRVALFHGGMRGSRFGVQPLLTKHPLLFPSSGLRYESSHHVADARAADFSGVLLHYKYVAGFVDYMRRIAGEGSFFNDSAEYKSYLRAIEADPALSLHSDTARELRHVDQLVDEGFMVVSDAYAARAGRGAA